MYLLQMASLGGIGLYSRHLTDDDVSNIGAATRYDGPSLMVSYTCANCLSERRHNHTGHICLGFLQCVFSQGTVSYKLSSSIVSDSNPPNAANSNHNDLP